MIPGHSIHIGPVEVRVDEAGHIDEVVARGVDVHLERMSDTSVWMRFGDCVVQAWSARSRVRLLARDEQGRWEGGEFSAPAGTPNPPPPGPWIPLAETEPAEPGMYVLVCGGGDVLPAFWDGDDWHHPCADPEGPPILAQILRDARAWAPIPLPRYP